jgi:hypothetical protein
VGKAEFLQLAYTLDIDKHPVGGKFISEKEDGFRFIWDGGVSRGVPVEQVPWANLDKSNEVPIATGLWTRYGKVYNAPPWWLDMLPDYPIDGELTSGRKSWQLTSSIVTSNVNVKDWSPIYAKVFDIPHPEMLFKDRDLTDTRFSKKLRGCYEFFRKRGGREVMSMGATFQTRCAYLERKVQENQVVRVHEQHRLPFSQQAAKARILEFTDALLELGGEGSIIKSPNDIWAGERVYSMLKFKPYMDAEAKVIGYTTGRETDKGSKLLGLMGALICEIDAGTFKMSGFTNEERYLYNADGTSAYDWCSSHPDEEVPDSIHSKLFPRGSVVTYRYRELTDGKLPKEARFWRKAA